MKLSIDLNPKYPFFFNFVSKSMHFWRSFFFYSVVLASVDCSYNSSGSSSSQYSYKRKKSRGKINKIKNLLLLPLLLPRLHIHFLRQPYRLLSIA
jgi:hypothetical protein